MQFLSAETIADLVTMPGLVHAIKRAFVASDVTPPRLVVSVPGGTGKRQFLGMPAFDRRGGAAVKLTMLYPDNAAKGLPVNQAVIVVFSDSGTPVAVLDGTIVTHLRTSATSALASRYLSRPDSRRLLVAGTGALAPFMAVAHCSARAIEEIEVWGRDRAKAERTAARIRSMVRKEIEVGACEDLPGAASTADIISCATSSSEPYLEGQWLRPGVFLDLVGSFTPQCREVDDNAVRKSRLFVDTVEGAMSEAGDILGPLSRGVISRSDIEGGLADLVNGRTTGRQDAEEITLFKSVGTAIEDLAAANLILSRAEAAR